VQMGLASLVEDLFQENTPYLPVQLDYQSGQRERIAKSLLAPRLVDNPHWESPICVGCRVYSIGFRSLALGWVCRPDGPQTRASLVQPICPWDSRLVSCNNVARIVSARLYDSCKIFKGRPRRNAFSKLVHRQYKSFPPHRFCQVEMKNPTRLSNKTNNA